jgi:peroxiredoxin
MRKQTEKKILIALTLATFGLSTSGSCQLLAAETRPTSSANTPLEAVGAAAPDFQLKDLRGEAIHLKDYRGKAVLLNFFATWCGPCRIEMPWFVDLQKKYRSQGLEIIGVAVDESRPEKLLSFTQALNVNYPIVQATDSMVSAYGGIMGLPMSFYIGRKGNIAAVVPGVISKDDIEANLKRIL